MEAAVIWELPGWSTDPATTLADRLNTPTKLAKMTLLDLFQGAVANGADPAELAKLWPLGRYIDRFEAGLSVGDLAGVQALLATIPVSLAPGTLAAVAAVVTANTLSTGRANWPEFDNGGNPTGDPPETFTAEWVTDALGAAGFVWGAGQWGRE